MIIAGIGVWAHYTDEGLNKTNDAFDILDVEVMNEEKVKPALIATAIVYLVLAVMIYIMSLWRSFIEAGHDATGVVSAGAGAFLITSVLLLLAWWFAVIWSILVLMADTVWAGLIYTAEHACGAAIDDIALFGPATWLPSSGLPCPGQCLDWTQFSYIDSDLRTACVCDVQKLTEAQGTFDSAYDDMTGVIVGIWLMVIGGLWLLVDFSCQYSHTKREKEYLHRISMKPF